MAGSEHFDGVEFAGSNVDRGLSKCHVQVLAAADLESNNWIEKILALDHQNMTAILRESGREFPESRRRRVLRDPSLFVVVLINEEELVGYLDFCDDHRDSKDIYLSSIQLAPRYRHGMSIAKLLAPAARALRKRSFRNLRGDVQRNNTTALALCSKLGFQMRERAVGQTSWDIVGDRTLLESAYVTRLLRRYVDGDAQDGRQSPASGP